ncbi:hypothetical protein QQF64_026184 [Cirrhinus molitorella]|uniref:Uncharacterized protein n=1 Tax=Cirrhinus molitorella TaxID=172907 RepID=A0ABR3NRU7_9TELE
MADIALPPPAPFLALPGAEGQRVLAGLESGTTSDYDTAVELQTAHFAAPQSLYNNTGASVSLLNMHTYNTFFGALPLSALSASLCGYGDSKTDLVGSLQVTVGYGNKILPSITFHVAHRVGQPDGSGFVLGSGIFSSRHKGTCIPDSLHALAAKVPILV